MPFDVTSWFENQATLRNPAIKKTFTINGSDYSSLVNKWPKIRRSWDSVRPVSITINLANDEKAFNFFNASPTTLMSSCSLQMGFTHPTSGDELLTQFTGSVERVKLSKGLCALTLIDRTKALSERLLGDRDAPLDFTTSDYLPSDLVWYIITSYGGYSAAANSSNPDIDYPAFSAWASIFSSDNVRMNANFKGIKCTEGLRKLARATQSAIFVKDGKISFHRFSTADSYSVSLDTDNLLSSQLSLDDKTVVNRQYVNAMYDTTSELFAATVFDVSSSSVNSYGPRESVEEDKTIWYSNSLGALNLAQRIVSTRKDPYKDYQLESGLDMLPRQIGETAYLTEPFFDAGGEYYRIMEQEVDMHNLTLRAKMDATMMQNGFTLDVSTLDGADVLL